MAVEAAANAPEDTSILADLRAQMESVEARLSEASDARQAAEDRNAALELELATLRTELDSIARLGRPTLFVQEGGYAVEDIGHNAVGVLSGFEGN